MVDRIKSITGQIADRGGVFMFLRAQLSAQVATIFDFLLTVLCVQFLDLYYIYATLIGAVGGGVLNCVINYKWTFKSTGCKKSYVAFKYFLVWIGSALLNTLGIVLLTEWLGSTYFVLIKVVVALVVAWIWNYNMQRVFVYKSYDTKRLFRRIN